jgi:hypothetical protein
VNWFEVFLMERLYVRLARLMNVLACGQNGTFFYKIRRVATVKKFLFLSSFVFAAILLMSASTLLADYTIVAVSNGSFELPGIGKIKGWNGEGNDGTPAVDIPGWASDGSAGDSGVESDWPGSTDGVYEGFLRNIDPSVYNTTSHVIAAGDSFKLRFDARDNWNSHQLMASLYYLDDTSRVTLDSVVIDLTPGSEGPWNEYTLAVDSVPVESIGKLLGIELDNIDSGDNDNQSWMGIDKVEFVPEPATYIMLILGAMGIAFYARRK